ncbi:hypothetical protein [Salinibaculum rarum]|uniref:hypothetical protein n=1 Tax=Salinibaculum rarum TaxID=3058903 RepID=UPI00265ED54A|nr:hypothetical protein [Salinibaculum sp. KK48]
MVSGGYDPADLDTALEALLDEDEIPEYLTHEEWDAYRRGDESLVDLLDGPEISQILQKKASEIEATE